VGRLELDSSPARALAEVMGRRWRHRNTLEPFREISPDAVRAAATRLGLDEREVNTLVKGSRALVREESARLERSEIIDGWVDYFGEEEGEDGSLVLDHPEEAEANRLAKRAKQNLRRNEALAAPGSAARRKSDEFWSLGP
jgi:hypothetical protein